MSSLYDDVRYALRSLRSARLTVLVLVSSFAVGTGANAVLYRAMDSLVFRQPPGVLEPHRLVSVFTSSFNGSTYGPSSHPDFVSLRQGMVGSIGTALWVLQGAVGFVLLIACANLANLILARAESRQREFAIRSALGASRFRLLRQFLTEGVLLALVGGALGAAIGFGGLRALLAANPDSIPRSLEISLDWKVLLFTLGVSVLTGLIFGMAPLLHLREQSVTSALKEGGQRSTAGSARARVRSGLVMVEVALAVVLVVGAGLLMRSFQKLMTVDPGFNRERMTPVRPDAAL